MSAPRPIFEIYVDDDRYSVPTLHLAPAADEFEALEIITRLLGENDHHLGAELYLDGMRLAGIGSFAETPRQRPEESAAVQ